MTIPILFENAGKLPCKQSITFVKQMPKPSI